MNKNKDSFIFLLVADSFNARVFKYYPDKQSIVDVADFVSQKSVLTDFAECKNLSGDQENKLKQGDLKKHATYLADQLFKIVHNQPNSLAIIATKEFTTELKRHLHREVSDKLTFELDKNIVHLSVAQISDYLKEKRPL